MTELDRVIHEPVRLRIAMVLSGLEEADFNFLLTALDLSRGNLSSHMSKLEEAGYVEIDKRFLGKLPHTTYRLTEAGRAALEAYWAGLEEIRKLAEDVKERETG